MTPDTSLPGRASDAGPNYETFRAADGGHACAHCQTSAGYIEDHLVAGAWTYLCDDCLAAHRAGEAAEDLAAEAAAAIAAWHAAKIEPQQAALPFAGNREVA